MIDLSRKIEKVIMSRILSSDEYAFIADLINSTKDLRSPELALRAYAMADDISGPIAQNHSLHQHVKLSMSIYHKLENVTLNSEDIFMVEK